jgi:hypothetical protein
MLTEVDAAFGVLHGVFHAAGVSGRAYFDPVQELSVAQCEAHFRRMQRVTVLARGFAWNGKTYPSLSKVAVAITGTNWNGPKFFGLRDQQKRRPAS